MAGVAENIQEVLGPVCIVQLVRLKMIRLTSRKRHVLKFLKRTAIQILLINV